MYIFLKNVRLWRFKEYIIDYTIKILLRAIRIGFQGMFLKNVRLRQFKDKTDYSL